MAIIIIIIIYNRRIEEQFFPSWTNLYLKFLVPKDPTWTPETCAVMYFWTIGARTM